MLVKTKQTAKTLRHLITFEDAELFSIANALQCQMMTYWERAHDDTLSTSSRVMWRKEAKTIAGMLAPMYFALGNFDWDAIFPSELAPFQPQAAQS